MRVSPVDFLDRAALAALQESRLRALLEEVLPRNRFVARKWSDAGLAPDSICSLSDWSRVPFTTKAELLADQAACPRYGTVLTYPRSSYCRLHQTSGTLGKPLCWLDTPQSWQWLLDCWKTMYRIAGVRGDDRLFFAFSFGPFLGFWTAFEAACQSGFFCLPAGGMNTDARLRYLLEQEASVILCTPTYALRLAEVASEEGIDLPGSPVRALIVAGEPGGSIAATRTRIELGWGSRVFDHNGMTEIGTVGIECPENPAGLHLLECDYIAEVVNADTGKPVSPGEMGELVLTNLGRVGSPLLRYRTGDLVRADPSPCPCGRALIRLQGGILGRTDDMIHLRGNNLYPSALEAVIRKFPEVAEFRVEVDQTGSLGVLRVELELSAGARATDVAERIDRAIHGEFLFRAEVRTVAPEVCRGLR